MDDSKLIEKLRNSQTIMVAVKPNSKRSEVCGYDERKKAYIVAIAAEAEKDKANKELLRLLKKETGKIFRIKSGIHGRNKLLAVDRS